MSLLLKSLPTAVATFGSPRQINPAPPTLTACPASPIRALPLANSHLIGVPLDPFRDSLHSGGTKMQTAARSSVRPTGVSARKAVHRTLVVPNAVKEVFMPALSSTMTEGKIVTWLKSVGDKVKKGEPIVVVESDKADMDVESFSEGILAALVVQEGERANVGAPIAFVAENANEVEDAKKKAAAMGGPAAAAPAAAAPAPAPVSRGQNAFVHALCPGMLAYPLPRRCTIAQLPG